MTHLNTPAVREHLGGVESAEYVRRSFDRGAVSQREEGFQFWFVEDRATGDLLGCAGFKRADSEGLPEELDGELEIGWILRKEAWGRGLGTEAAKAAMDAGFGRLEAQRVVALTSRRNVASWRIMERLGMNYRPEWDFVDPGFAPRDNPTIIYELTRENWENQE